MGITPGIIAGGLSMAGGLEGLFGNQGANNVQLPQMQPINTQNIQSNLNSSIPQLSAFNLGGQNYNQYQGVLQNTLANPFAGQAVGGAQQFGGQGASNAWNAYGNAGMLGQTVGTSIGAGNQILNTAFDPQNALFKQQQDLMSQQSLAGLAGAGLVNTPWGQGVYGQNMGNFDINWQNQQLGRQATGINAANSAFGEAGIAGQQALGIGQSATQGGAADTMLPYNTQNIINSNQLNALTGGAQYGIASSQIPQTGIGDWLQYLSGANSANSTANDTAQLALRQNQQAWNQSMQAGNMFGQGLAGMAGYSGGMSPFGSSPSYGGGNMFSGDAYGGNAFNPLPGLDASDYG